MNTEIISKLIPPTVSLIVTSLFGLLVGVLVEKFKNRYKTIEYSIRSQKIIPSLSQDLGGQLSIKLNDKETNTLKVTTVEIENKNSIDFENVLVQFSLSSNTWFQGNEAFLSENFSDLYWTPEYTESYNQILAEYNECAINPEDNEKIIPYELQNRINYALANRAYLIPVFNRKEKAIFNFLIEDPIDGSDGFIYPSIVHKSVRFIEKSDDSKQQQKDLWIGIAIGILIVITAITLIVRKNPEQQSLIIWSAIIGFSYSIVGYLLLFVFKRIKSFFN